MPKSLSQRSDLGTKGSLVYPFGRRKKTIPCHFWMKPLLFVPSAPASELAKGLRTNTLNHKNPVELNKKSKRDP